MQNVQCDAAPSVHLHAVIEAEHLRGHWCDMSRGGLANHQHHKEISIHSRCLTCLVSRMHMLTHALALDDDAITTKVDHTGCVSSMPDGEGWKCMFAQEAYARTKLQTFVENSHVDAWQLQCIFTAGDNTHHNVHHSHPPFGGIPCLLCSTTAGAHVRVCACVCLWE